MRGRRRPASKPFVLIRVVFTVYIFAIARGGQAGLTVEIPVIIIYRGLARAEVLPQPALRSKRSAGEPQGRDDARCPVRAFLHDVPYPKVFGMSGNEWDLEKEVEFD